MAEILNNILDGSVSVNELISQLNSSDCVVAVKFVPYFLNYIRENTSWAFENQATKIELKFHNKTEDNDNIKSPDHLADETCRKSTPATKGKDLLNGNDNINLGVLSLGYSSYTPINNKRNKKKYAKTSPSLIKEAKAPDIGDIDAFPPIGANEPSAKVIVRRINPTQLKRTCATIQSSSFSAHSKQLNVFDSSPLQDREDSALKAERLLLKETREALQHATNNLTSASSPSKKNYSQSDATRTPKPLDIVIPNISQVSCKEMLQLLVDIYSALFNNGLVPNITSELYYLFQLLTACIESTAIAKNTNIFTSVHNCIYFIVTLLKQQKNLLCFLDKRTLKSLLNIPYIKEFSLEFINDLNYSIDDNCFVRRRTASSISEVPYRADTDTRRNFATNQSFTSFSKQRDLFYEIMYAWQENSGLSDISFERWFTKKCQNLIEVGAEMLNFFHLAKLIRSQILISCLNGDNVDQIPQFLTKDKSQDKLAKLEERLSVRKGNPCPLPDFPGMQSFFEAFFKVTSSSVLNTHLANLMKMQILENNSNFYYQQDACSSEEIQEKFHYTLLEMRLLAKFLGHLTFLPYKSPKVLPRYLLEMILQCRKDIAVDMDCVKILEAAEQNGHLVLTVPWIVEYLSMIDESSKLLDQYTHVYKFLAKIYQGQVSEKMTNTNFQFLRVMIGWLFESQNFPVMLKYSCVANNNVIVNEKCLDMLNVVDSTLIYACCPYLYELRSILDDFHNCIPRKSPARKITPMPTAQLKEEISDDKKLELAMEEYFFFLQPTVMKKTVEFVAERISSNFIFDVNKMLHSTVEIYVTRICENSHDVMNTEEMQVTVLQDGAKICQEVKKWTMQRIHDTCFLAVRTAFDALVGNEFNEGAIENACKLSTRLVFERLTIWLNNNVVVDSIKSDFKNRLTKALKKKKICTERCASPVLDNESFTLSPSQCLKDLRKVSLELKDKSADLALPHLIHLCENMTDVIEKKFSFICEKSVILTTVNIAIYLIAYQPNNFTRDFVLSLANLWQACEPHSVDAKMLLSPCNIQYLSESTSIRLASEKMCMLLKKLIDRNLITKKEIQNYITSKECHHESVIKYISDLIDDIEV